MSDVWNTHDIYFRKRNHLLKSVDTIIDFSGKVDVYGDRMSNEMSGSLSRKYEISPKYD